MHVHCDPYPIQFGSGDWITVITNVTGTFTGKLALPDGTVIDGTGKAFDVEFGQTSKWEGDESILISAFGTPPCSRTRWAFPKAKCIGRSDGRVSGRPTVSRQFFHPICARPVATHS